MKANLQQPKSTPELDENEIEDVDQTKKNDHHRVKTKMKPAEKRLKDSMNIYFVQDYFEKENENQNAINDQENKEDEVQSFSPEQIKDSNDHNKIRKRRRVAIKHEKENNIDQQENQYQDENEDDQTPDKNVNRVHSPTSSLRKTIKSEDDEKVEQEKDKNKDQILDEKKDIEANKDEQNKSKRKRKTTKKRNKSPDIFNFENENK